MPAPVFFPELISPNSKACSTTPGVWERYWQIGPVLLFRFKGFSHFPKCSKCRHYPIASIQPKRIFWAVWRLKNMYGQKFLTAQKVH